MADITYINRSPSQAPASIQAPPVKTPPSIEEIKEAVKETTGKLFGAAIEPESETPPTPAQPTAPVAPAPAEPPAPAPATAPEPGLAPAEPPMTKEEIRAAVREEMRQTTPPAPAASAAPSIELGTEDSKDLKAIQYLEQTGKLPRGKAQEYTDFVAKNYAYQDQWTEKNPDKAFNPDDEEHEEWYAANTPKDLPGREELNEALLEAIADEKAEERWQKRMQPKIDIQNADEAFEREKGTIARNFDNHLVTLVEKIDPNLANLLKKDGQPALGPDAQKALEEADAIASDEINDIITRTGLDRMLIELEKLPIPECRKLFNPEKNPVHRRIALEFATVEKQMASAARDVQVQDGKQWISASDFQKRVDAGESAEELNRTTWRISVDDIADLLVDDAAKQAKAAIERTKKKHEKYSSKNGTQPASPPPTAGNGPPVTVQPPITAPTSIPPVPRRGSPDTSSAADLTSPGSPVGGGGDKFVETVTNKLFRK